MYRRRDIPAGQVIAKLAFQEIGGLFEVCVLGVAGICSIENVVGESDCPLVLGRSSNVKLKVVRIVVRPLLSDFAQSLNSDLVAKFPQTHNPVAFLHRSEEMERNGSPLE